MKKKKFIQYGSLIMADLIIILFFLLFGNMMGWFSTKSDLDTTSQPDSSTNTTKDIVTETARAETTLAATTRIITTMTNPIPKDEEYVKVTDYIPTIFVDLKYASENNITGQSIYNFTEAYLRYGTVLKLISAQNELVEAGYSIKIWDAYRPVEAQYKLWEAMPQEKYIANPNKGYTSHSLGNTLDITLVTIDGDEIDMPTGFDNFTALADRNYKDVTSIQAEHALLLEKTMIKHGFKPYSGEWWHFSDAVIYAFDENFIP